MPVSYSSTLFLDKSGTPTKKMRALDVARLSLTTRKYRPVRSVNIKSREITSDVVLSIIKRMNERLIHLETDCGYILECTNDTLLLSANGWIPVYEVDVGTEIWVNGQPSEAYKDKEFLEEWYVRRHKTQKEIAEMCSTEEHPVAERTVRAWIKKYGLGRGDAGALYGKDNPRYKEDLDTLKGLYARARFGIVKKNVCAICGREGPTDIHHEDHNLLDSEEDNLIEICEKCHQMEHKGAVIKHTRPAKITVKRTAGVEPTVHFIVSNYVASGFIIKGEDESEQRSEN